MANESEEDQPVKEEKRSEFDIDDLQKAWNDFAIRLKKSGKDSDYAALNGDLELVEKENIRLTLTNKVQMVALENLKQDLLGYLRKELKNQFIDLQVEIKKVEEKELKYTNREKFEFLATKYPKLHDLKRRLDLDPDF